MRPTNKVMAAQNEKLAGALGVVCDKLCRWPVACTDQEELEEGHCIDCPLQGIVDLFDEIRGKASC